MLNSSKGGKLLVLDEDIDEIKVISANVYNKDLINSIGQNYKHLRQESKAP